MFNRAFEKEIWNRRQVLKAGLTAGGIAGTIGLWQLWNNSRQGQIKIPPLETEVTSGLVNPMTMVRDFDYGTIKQENGRKIREFRINATNETIKLNSAVTFNVWSYNKRVPGPTLRASEGDRIRVLFFNQGGHSHTIHFHGIHRAEDDGVRAVTNNSATIYEFDAEPYGVHLYHCHIEPVTRHITKGLYGMFIVDPPNPRPPADEMVLIMGGYDVNDDNRNELYALNGLPDYYLRHPIPIYQNQLVRLYVLNMIEFDPVATFHLHANFFRVYPTGMTLKPLYEADVISMGTAERHILEFSYKYPGKYMFHPHQDYIAEHGCMGNFAVIPQEG